MPANRFLVVKLSSISLLTRTEAFCERHLITKHDPTLAPPIGDAGAMAYLFEAVYSSSPDSQENTAATLLSFPSSPRTPGCPLTASSTLSPTSLATMASPPPHDAQSWHSSQGAERAKRPSARCHELGFWQIFWTLRQSQA
ncbi:hypothetical protein NL676_034958 [Syzygium grande]|nr:hypothetical protein NL676_034958 [Syzygium grande]